MSFAYHYDVYKPEEEFPVKIVKGVLSIEGEELLFEYKLYDPAGTVISTLNKYSLQVDFLKKILFKKSLFGSKMMIETKQMIFLEPIPGSEQGKIMLKINREDRNQAQDFATKLNIALSERRLKDLEKDGEL